MHREIRLHFCLIRLKTEVQSHQFDRHLPKAKEILKLRVLGPKFIQKANGICKVSPDKKDKMFYL